MREVKRILMAALMGLVLSLGALVPIAAFGQKNTNRPPKEPEKVKQPDKQPRGNSNSQGNSNRHGRN
jgi:cytoskeletal protein RodZ